MVQNPEILEQAELKYEREHPLTLEQRFELFEHMYQLAVELGGFGVKKREEATEEIVSLAKALRGKLSRAAGAYSAGAGKG